MCTVSIIPLDTGGLRIVFNRDEQRVRPAAEPPRECGFGDRRAVLPRDPAGGGTWIAASDAGLVLMLLNVKDDDATARAAPTAPRRSRGLIIPSLLHLSGVDAVVQHGLRLRAADFASFRLVVASTGGCIELFSDGVRIRCRGAVLPGRIAMFTSSGLGDQLVEPPRRRFFDALLGDGLHSAERQDAFHRHQWLDRPHLSVWMTRADARTVSRTIVELRDDQAVMHYASLDEAGGERDRVTHLLAVAADVMDDSRSGRDAGDALEPLAEGAAA